MIIDLICGAFCLIYAIFGYLTGGLKQLVKVVAMVLAYFSAVWVSPIIAELMAEYIKIPNNYLELVALIVSWIGFYILYRVLGRFFVRAIHEASETITALDSMVGGLLGLLKGIVIVAIFCFLISSQRSRIIYHRPESKVTLNESYALKAVDKSYLLEPYLPDDTFKLVELLGSISDKVKFRKSNEPKSKPVEKPLKNDKPPVPKHKSKYSKKEKKKDPADLAVEQSEKASKESALKQLEEHKGFMDILKDKKLMDSMKDKNMSDLLNDPRVKKLLKDPEVMELIKKLSNGDGEAAK